MSRAAFVCKAWLRLATSEALWRDKLPLGLRLADLSVQNTLYVWPRLWSNLYLTNLLQHVHWERCDCADEERGPGDVFNPGKASLVPCSPGKIWTAGLFTQALQGVHIRPQVKQVCSSVLVIHGILAALGFLQAAGESPGLATTAGSLRQYLAALMSLSQCQCSHLEKLACGARQLA